MYAIRQMHVTPLLLAAALALQGCDSDSDDPQMMPPADTTAPTVSDVQVPVTTPLNRTVTLTVDASDNTAVTEVRFFVDGTLLEAVTGAPFSVEWDTSTAAEGDHVLSAEAEDAAGNVAQSGDVTVTVQNLADFAVSLSAVQEVPPLESAGSAVGNLSVNLSTGEVSGDLSVTGITPTAAHIHDAFAGENGDVLIGLDQDPGDAGLFTVPAGATLDPAGVDRLLAGALYLNVHTAAHPGGEIRGQILPDGFELYFTELGAELSVPPLESSATGRAAVTFDPATGALVVHAQVSGLDDATDAHVHEGYAGSNGAVLVGLTQDAMDPGHWFVEDGSLNASGAAALAAGALYVNVHSPAHPGGEIRGHILPEGIVVLRTELQGAQEVPPVATDATGVAFLTLDEAGSLASIHAMTSDLDDASDAHLHSGLGGIPGPVEIGLTQDGSDPAHWFVNEAPLTPGQLDLLLNAATYVNVHSPDHPGGEIRGQLVPENFLFAAGLLQGEQEVPRVTSAAGGMFAVTVDTDAMTLTAHANTTGADDASAAHLHDAYAGMSGGVEIGLSQDGSDPAHWLVEEAALAADQLAAFAAGRWYVNVHTPANPGGEIRGQAAPRDIEVLFSALSGDQVVPPVTTSAGGIAATTMNLATQEFVVVLNLEDADDAVSAGVYSGAAGENGPLVLPLAQSAMPVSQWSAMATLDDDTFADYGNGALYALVTTPGFPDGELRAQIEGERDVAPPPDSTAPTVTLTSPGADVSGTVSLEADAADDVAVVEVRFLAGGVLIASDDSAPYAVDWDTTAVANGDVVLTAEAEDAAGNVGTSDAITVAVNNAEAVSFASIQSSVFGPRCSGCHTGPTGGTLPGGMDLSSAADSYAALVGVPSIQVPSLDRVEPGDPDNSYLIRKLEGGPGITGTRMPQGGPFLSQATIDEIRQWIADGAPDN